MIEPAARSHGWRSWASWLLAVAGVLLVAQTVWILLDREDDWVWDLVKSVWGVLICLVGARSLRRPRAAA